ncbi:ABC transporter ATP-binding protein [Peptostreptococcus faecalis]|uniref:ABC transporter ATP-binding protein n=1 Tax=Peptostreptococcus faecalis TaxID=2045015 RepID=UPI000C7D58CD|nr:ABC transporter ATP-binding protein [Peptostreptococcus faecalis]
MTEIVKIKNLGKVYESGKNKYKALENINLDVKEKDFIGIMGPSGSGKSTLLNIMSTIDKPTSGDVLIDNEDILKMNEGRLSLFRRDRLGFIFQDFNLLDTLTVKENIALPLALSKKSSREINREVLKVSKKLGIETILNKYPHEISGGQRQRTAACRAIVTNPSLILADEPTGALDSKTSKDFLKLLKELNEIDGVTIVMVTHDAFAASFCKKVIFIKDGHLENSIVKTASQQEFFDRIIEHLAKIGDEENGSI